MFIAFAMFFAFYTIAGIVTRFVTMKWPDSFISQGLLYATH